MSVFVAAAMLLSACQFIFNGGDPKPHPFADAQMNYQAKNLHFEVREVYQNDYDNLLMSFRISRVWNAAAPTESGYPNKLLLRAKTVSLTAVKAFGVELPVDQKSGFRLLVTRSQCRQE